MNYQRQMDLLSPDEIIFPVIMVGCGGIGTPTVLNLAKAGFENITLIDPDSVEDHNLPNQFFRLSDLERKKVDALKDMVLDFSDCFVKIIPEFFENQPLSGIVVSGVDSMKSRQAIWSRVKYNVEVPLYVDGRIGGEILQVFTIRPSQIEDIELYEKHLFPDEEAEELPCTARAIIYTGSVIGGSIVSQVKKWLKNEQYYRYISFDLKTMTIVTQ